MHIKVTSPSDYNLGVKTAEVMKVSGKGLVGDDLNAFIKRAGHVFDKQLANIKIEKDEIPLHVIALGATEAYGPNRNGDGFKAATCRQMHDTFVKHARWYRNHKNKDPEISYGVIKASAFNEAMQRVELIVALNAEKSAAARNGGFVADDELKLIGEGKDIPVSMACKVAYDVCASCGNKARHREEYCTEDTCVGPHGEKRGGCKNHLTEVAADGFINHVDNPNPEWFDMSKVYNPADRIAYGGVADYFQKAASGEVLGGYELARAWGLGGLAVGRFAADWTEKFAAYRLVERLAEEEQGWATPDDFRTHAGRVMASQADLDLSLLQGRKTAALGALQKCRVSMKVADFVRWQGGDDALAQEVAARVPGVYGRLQFDPALPQMLRNNPFDQACPASVEAVQWVGKQAGLVCQTEHGFQDALYTAAIRNVQPARVKQASKLELPSDARCEQLARSYALYKLAYLTTVPVGPERELAVRLAVAQNYV